MRHLTPKALVEDLDRHIVGKSKGKRAVAIAIRNRWRRAQLPKELQQEVTPKNIIMIGPTGVGKTEIARRLANMLKAPFCKVEATKYTEVGYHGRDVESVIRELVDAAFRIVREVEREKVEPEARKQAEERLLDLLVPPPDDHDLYRMDDFVLSDNDDGESKGEAGDEETAKKDDERERYQRTRDKMREKLAAGQLDDRKVELRTEQRQVPVQIFSNMGMEQMDVDFQNMFERLMPRESKDREMTVAQARKHLIEQQIDLLIDKESAGEQAIELAEQSGIVFIDEIDKVSAPQSSHGPDVSRQGVQRDLLPIVEGTSVQTRHGTVRTDHVLFIAAGAFHVSKPADMMPELQGRFPIRVELDDLGRDDFARILREPKNAITRQYVELLGTEGLTVTFQDDAIDEIARIADQVNKNTQNIGARRLHTVMERLLEEPSFDADHRTDRALVVDGAYVRKVLEPILQKEDVSQYIL